MKCSATILRRSPNSARSASSARQPGSWRMIATRWVRTLRQASSSPRSGPRLGRRSASALGTTSSGRGRSTIRSPYHPSAIAARLGTSRTLTSMEAGSATRPRQGALVEVTIDALAHGGAGVGRLDGYVVFVRDAIPGDRVRAEVVKRKRAYADARLVDLLEPSPERIAPVADHPGAPWQVLPYERQLEVKQEQVGDALRRIGRLDGFELEPIVPAEQQWRYRNKIEFSFGTAEDGELVCGFHAPGSWERIVAMEECLLVSERVDETRRRVLEFCREQGLQAWDRRDQSGFLRNLMIREGRRTGELQVRLVTSEGELDDAGL